MDGLDCAVKGRILHQLGLGLYYLNREKEAITLFESAYNKVWAGCREVGTTEKANTAFNIGVCYQYTSEAMVGKKYIEQAMTDFAADKNYSKSDLCYKYQGAGNFFTTVKDLPRLNLTIKRRQIWFSTFLPVISFIYIMKFLFSTYLSENGSPQEKRQIS
ncbi:MAG: hypothetical protein IPP37_07895 [Saprospiraceae bacterium]|nr:hypothetical protein [Saprospiraceae bacterium]